VSSLFATMLLRYNMGPTSMSITSIHQFVLVGRVGKTEGTSFVSSLFATMLLRYNKGPTRMLGTSS